MSVELIEMKANEMNGKESYFLWNEWNAADGRCALITHKQKSLIGAATAPINSFSLLVYSLCPPRNHQTNQIHFISLNCLIGLLHRQPLVFIVGSLPWASGPSHNLPQFNFTGWLSSPPHPPQHCFSLHSAH